MVSPRKVSGSLQGIQRVRILAVQSETAGNISETARPAHGQCKACRIRGASGW